MFRTSSPKSRFLENFHHNMGFLEIFHRNRDISKILIKIEIFRDFDQNCHFLSFGPNRDTCISKILTSIKIFQKFWPKSRFSDIWTKSEMFRMKSRSFKNYDQSWNFREFWPESLFLGKFSKIDIFHNFDQNFTKTESFKDFDENHYFSKIMTKI